MKITLLFSALAACSASMAEDFVRNGNINSNISASVESTSKQKESRRNKRSIGKRVLRGTAHSEWIGKRELKDHKKDKNDKDSFIVPSQGLNYFVPNYPDKQNNSKFYSKSSKPDNVGYTRPRPYQAEPSTGNSREPEPVYDDKLSNTKPNDDEEKANAEKVNAEFAEETNGWLPTPEPSSEPTLEPTLESSEQPTLAPTLIPTLTPSYIPTASSGKSSFTVLTGSPTFEETGAPTTADDVVDESSTSLTGAPTFEETGVSPAADTNVGKSSTSSTIYIETTQSWDEGSTHDSWGPSKSTRTRSPSTSAPTQYVSTTAPTLVGASSPPTDSSDATTISSSPSPMPSTNAPTAPSEDSTYSPTLLLTNSPTYGGNVSSYPTMNLDVTNTSSTQTGNEVTSTSGAESNSSDTPTYYPTKWTFIPTSYVTYSPTTYESRSPTTATSTSASSTGASSTGATVTGVTSTGATSTGATFSGSGCISDFCEEQLTSDYLMQYKVNVPEGSSVEECYLCSVTIRLTYEGDAWLGFAFSTDGQMVGSQAVM